MHGYLRKSAMVGAAVVAIASLAAMKVDRGPQQQLRSNARLVADLSDKILYLYEGDSVVTMYDISDGKDPYPTPRGSFRIRKLNWNPSWTPPDSKWAAKKRPTGPG